MIKSVFAYVAILFAIALFLGLKDSSFKPPKAPAKPAAWYRVNYPGRVFTKAEEVRMAVDSFEPVIYGRISDPVAAIERLGKYDSIIKKSATAIGVPSPTLRAVLFLESQGRADAVVRYHGKVVKGSCAGIGQFAPATARGYGLVVSKDWVALYLAYESATNPVVRAKRWAKLQKYDQRFVPRLAIPATARYLKESSDVFGGLDWGVAAYHMGGGNLSRARRMYKEGWNAPKELYWPEVVLSVNPDQHPKTYQFLESLEDDSIWYWFRVRKAESELRLWYSGPAGRKAFRQKASFYDWAKENGRRDRLAKEYIWYKRGSLPVYEAKDIPKLRSEGKLIDLVTGKRYVASSDVSHPYLAPSAMGAILYLQSEVRRMGGGRLTVTSAFRTYSQMSPTARAGKYSTHRLGLATDLRLVEGRTGDAMIRTLQKMRDRGEVVFCKEGDHWHVTFGPEAKAYVSLPDGIAAYEETVSRYEAWAEKWEGWKAPTLGQAFRGRLAKVGTWGWALLGLIALGIALLFRPAKPAPRERYGTAYYGASRR